MLLNMIVKQSQRVYQQQFRSISALYVTGDKAKENYVVLHPYMDFESSLSDTNILKNSIARRQMKVDMTILMEKYTQYKEHKSKIIQLEKERELAKDKLKHLLMIKANDAECTSAKNYGKELRNELKSLKESFYPIEDEFVHMFLNLPNELHRNCPDDGVEKILYRSAVPKPKQGIAHLQRKDLIRFIDNSRYYMMNEAAEFDVYCTQAFCNSFVTAGGFTQTSNPDFVRCVLLEANATPLNNYHLVVEENLQNTLNPAYLTGGAAFESFLGAFTKLCIYPSVLPIRFVSCGRSYQKVYGVQKSTCNQLNLFTATQTNAVQTFVATPSAHEADEQMENILNLIVNFYQKIGIHFRISYANANRLTLAECLRAEIEVYSPAQQCYVCVGCVSNYNDFVSKRILFSMQQQKSHHHFLHIVGGPVLYTTRLIAALIENGIPLEHANLLGGTYNSTETSTLQSDIKEFKKLFD